MTDQEFSDALANARLAGFFGGVALSTAIDAINAVTSATPDLFKAAVGIVVTVVFAGLAKRFHRDSKRSAA